MKNYTLIHKKESKAFWISYVIIVFISLGNIYNLVLTDDTEFVARFAGISFAFILSIMAVVVLYARSVKITDEETEKIEAHYHFSSLYRNTLLMCSKSEGQKRLHFVHTQIRLEIKDALAFFDRHPEQISYFDQWDGIKIGVQELRMKLEDYRELFEKEGIRDFPYPKL